MRNLRALTRTRTACTPSYQKAKMAPAAARVALATAAAAAGPRTEAAVVALLLSGGPGGASSGSGSVMVVPMGEPTGAASSSSMASSAMGPSAPSKDPMGVCAMGVRMLGLVSASSGAELPVGEESAATAAAPVRTTTTRSRTTRRDTAAMVRAPCVQCARACGDQAEANFGEDCCRWMKRGIWTQLVRVYFW